MDEQTFIYNRLNFLNEQLISLSKSIEKMLNEQENIITLVEMLNKRIDQVSSYDYIKKIIKQNEIEDINNKINFIKGNL